MYQDYRTVYCPKVNFLNDIFSWTIKNKPAIFSVSISFLENSYIQFGLEIFKTRGPGNVAGQLDSNVYKNRVIQNKNDNEFFKL